MSKNQEKFNRKTHWERIYENKASNEVSWYQEKPEASLQFIKDLNLPKKASILDVGAGDSNLVDFLLENAFSNITVLDISEKAINRTKYRLGEKGRKIHWAVSDILKFKSDFLYDIWHDRAAFHFLTKEIEIQKYVDLASKLIKPNGYLLIATFAHDGPLQCSGIEITRYSKEKLEETFQHFFELKACLHQTHNTPFKTNQKFMYCCFKRKKQ